jgi:hypothetical protein
MATNQYGLDVSYFQNCIDRDLGRGLNNYRPDEFARVCLRMAVTADAKVLLEPEFVKIYDNEIDKIIEPSCCEGGPQWGHAWDCKKLH